jgi:hypothetical protein
MSVEIRTEHASIETQAGDGLHALVFRAAKAAQRGPLDAGGMLVITPETQDPGCALAIDADIADDGVHRVIAKLDVRVVVRDARVSEELVRAALSVCGGAGLTSLTFSSPTSREEVMDITVSFPSRFPFYATNTAIIGEQLTQDDAERAAAGLSALGVRFSREGNRVRVSRRQLRGRVGTDAQVRALITLLGAGDGRPSGLPWHASLYAAPLPPNAAVRIAYQRAPSEADGAQLELGLSRGLAGDSVITEEDARAVERVLTTHTGVVLVPRRFSVKCCRWDAPAAERALATQPLPFANR